MPRFWRGGRAGARTSRPTTAGRRGYIRSRKNAPLPANNGETPSLHSVAPERDPPVVFIHQKTQPITTHYTY